MKKLFLASILMASFLASCKSEKKEATTTPKPAETAYVSFGEEFTANAPLTKENMRAKFENLQSGDTLAVSFTSTINDVCQKKGCWMKLDLGAEKESMVRFKDYGFFMPLNSAKSEVIVHGKAFVKVTPVAELQHYAKDAGKSEEEIAAITEPKYTYAFLADGVRLKK